MSWVTRDRLPSLTKTGRFSAPVFFVAGEEPDEGSPELGGELHLHRVPAQPIHGPRQKHVKPTTCGVLQHASRGVTSSRLSRCGALRVHLQHVDRLARRHEQLVALRAAENTDSRNQCGLGSDDGKNCLLVGATRCGGYPSLWHSSPQPAGRLALVMSMPQRMSLSCSVIRASTTSRTVQDGKLVVQWGSDFLLWDRVTQIPDGEHCRGCRCLPDRASEADRVLFPLWALGGSQTLTCLIDTQPEQLARELGVHRDTVARRAG